MFLGKVVGTVWATKKAAGLEGLKLLLVHPYNLDGDPVPDLVVAADRIGAGHGEDVIVAYGKAARQALGSQDLPVEAAVVGLVDEYDLTAECRAPVRPPAGRARSAARTCARRGSARPSPAPRARS